MCFFQNIDEDQKVPPSAVSGTDVTPTTAQENDIRQEIIVTSDIAQKMELKNQYIMVAKSNMNKHTDRQYEDSGTL